MLVETVLRHPEEARPFLKWAGGKGQLLPELLPRVPSSFGRYLEPFVGSGALFFALVARGRLRPEDAILSDANGRLVDVYRAIRDDVEAVIEELSAFRNDADQYYAVRAWQHENLSPAMAAARIIYLNKTCYNGLYRENRRGEFNVPFGRYKKPNFRDEPALRTASAALQGAMIACRQFEAVSDSAPGGDFVYFDPPYHPLSATSSFTDYHGPGFGIEQQRRLAALFRELDRRGVRMMLSNSDTPLVRELYAGYLIDEVQASRAINSKGDRRGRITELVIRNGEQR